MPPSTAPSASSPASSATSSATARSIFPMKSWSSSTTWSPPCTPSFTLPQAEMTERIIRAMANPYVTLLGPSDRPPAALARRLPGRYPGRHRSRRGDRHRHRAQCQPDAARAGLALVAAGQGEGREVRHQSRCARDRDFAESALRHRHGPQRLANAGGRGELPAAR